VHLQCIGRCPLLADQKRARPIRARDRVHAEHRPPQLCLSTPCHLHGICGAIVRYRTVWSVVRAQLMISARFAPHRTGLVPQGPLTFDHWDEHSPHADRPISLHRLLLPALSPKRYIPLVVTRHTTSLCWCCTVIDSLRRNPVLYAEARTSVQFVRVAKIYNRSPVGLLFLGADTGPAGGRYRIII